MAQDVDVFLDHPALQGGDTPMGDHIRARLYGKKDAPLIIVLGGISATRFIADEAGQPAGWWPAMVGEGSPIDLRKTQVLGLDFAPQSHGDGSAIALSTQEQASRLRSVLDHLGIETAAAIIGASYGGMVALAFAKDTPARLGALCVISATHRPFPLGVAWRGIQRRIVRLAIQAGRPEDGLALARELAMTTYRSAEEFTERFEAMPTGANPTRFDVCDYLMACGAKFSSTMSAERFMALSESIDLHRVEPEDIKTPALLIASRSDQLAPPAEMQILQSRLGGPSDLVTLDSPYGHDAFLKETKALGSLLSAFINEQCHVR
ncbi:MAG: homoserine O-succinyltransferase [Robiginitomaculum sp.]|nr:homoserine O-succinyltransferase [Robiginitomaculum sp.]MDQ7077908.1 homoserine O-succinyltransferase [Robiginitomaculum sp.]